MFLLWSSLYRELSRSVHWRERFRLQGFWLPPRHPTIHVPGKALLLLSKDLKLDKDCFSYWGIKPLGLLIGSELLFQLFRVVTSRITMELVESPSTATSLQMRTSLWSTQDLAFCPWLTQDPTPMAHSFSSALQKPAGEGLVSPLPLHGRCNRTPYKYY